jgi:dTDP-glucose pyrophosphorylase
MRKALILAAGRGTRMGVHTQSMPKALLDLNGKPMLHHILDRLQQAGIGNVLLITGYLADQIEAAAGAHPLKPSFLRQVTLNGTATAARLARDWAAGDDFLLTFGDILTESENYGAMAVKKRSADAVLGVRLVDDPYQGAAVYADASGRVSRIIEKPPIGTSRTNWNSAGVYAFGASVFTELARVPLSERGEYELTSAITQLLDGGANIVLHSLSGDWLDVGRPEDLERARRLTA